MENNEEQKPERELTKSELEEIKSDRRSGCGGVLLALAFAGIFSLTMLPVCSFYCNTFDKVYNFEPSKKSIQDRRAEEKYREKTTISPEIPYEEKTTISQTLR